MTLNEYIATEKDKATHATLPIAAVVCIDGFTISVQASRHHYCEPRENDGPWTHVECGFPSEAVPTIEDYKDGDDNDCESVFAGVPIELVEELIASHGGRIITEGTIEQLQIGMN
jgi:hypothetical protein